MPQSRYQKALDFLYSRQHFGAKLGMENMQQLSAGLGYPENSYPTVHIAGTNGKGSTSSYIASILQAAGNRVGLLTSPHIADFRERIRVNRQKIDRAAVAEFIETYRTLFEKSNATFFEITTAMSFWYFKKKKVDWGVIEVGLGGRLDATNVITPVISVITNIDLEHTEILGKSIYKIAGEKAGIIKPAVPLVTSVPDDQNDAARRFREVCRDREAPIYFANARDYDSYVKGGYDHLRIQKGKFAGLTTKLSLRGRHQVQNGYLAVCTIEILCQMGEKVSAAALCKGLATNYWPARFMTIRRNPEVIIDAGHNPAGFETLIRTLRQYYPGRQFDFLISLVEKKRGELCLKMIAPLARSISTAAMNSERGDDPYRLISGLDFGHDRVRVYPDVVQAYKDLLENSRRSDILVITGSHYLIGELAPYLKRDGF